MPVSTWTSTPEKSTRLLGRTGAGKTRWSSIYGYYQRDASRNLVDGVPVTLRSLAGPPAESGCGFRLTLIPALTVENVALFLPGLPVVRSGRHRRPA
jgi:ABC-type uncharacterized transport system ATPase subunit